MPRDKSEQAEKKYDATVRKPDRKPVDHSSSFASASFFQKVMDLHSAEQRAAESKKRSHDDLQPAPELSKADKGKLKKKRKEEQRALVRLSCCASKAVLLS